MARYTESACRLCRREGEKLFLKGGRCYSGKCAVSRRSYAPGQHGQAQMRRKMSEYGIQMREKQKTKRFYGVLEKQFHKTFQTAERMQGKTGENLLSLLERRFDNIVYRMGLAASRSEARQLVLHGHYTVNGKKANIPSMFLNAGDEVAVAEGSRDSAKFKDMEAGRTIPHWLSVNMEQLKGTVVSLPGREDIDLEVKERLIVELYSK
ncbi:MAG: 30S ribosomal protein S4 [Oscillospiraceae bacterium]|nr:30S ribosomal protein S4 [Oscillospiraceae bacterium]MDD4367755.1 30S ribosomal protein S4 [Oscillospiraceae bacterium]